MLSLALYGPWDKTGLASVHSASSQPILHAVLCKVAEHTWKKMAGGLLSSISALQHFASSLGKLTYTLHQTALICVTVRKAVAQCGGDIRATCYVVLDIHGFAFMITSCSFMSRVSQGNAVLSDIKSSCVMCLAGSSRWVHLVCKQRNHSSSSSSSGSNHSLQQRCLQPAVGHIRYHSTECMDGQQHSSSPTQQHQL